MEKYSRVTELWSAGTVPETEQAQLKKTGSSGRDQLRRGSSKVGVQIKIPPVLLSEKKEDTGETIVNYVFTDNPPVLLVGRQTQGPV